MRLRKDEQRQESFSSPSITAAFACCPACSRRQLDRTRETYFNLSNADVLKGFREQAGQPAPGKGLEGWCSKTSAVVFGQWLSGMARMSSATGDTALRSKALSLADGWAKTTQGGIYGFDTYSYEKIVCGLVDLALYADYTSAWPQLERVTEWASKSFDRRAARLPRWIATAASRAARSSGIPCPRIFTAPI